MKHRTDKLGAMWPEAKHCTANARKISAVVLYKKAFITYVRVKSISTLAKQRRYTKEMQKILEEQERKPNQA